MACAALMVSLQPACRQWMVSQQSLQRKLGCKRPCRIPRDSTLQPGQDPAARREWLTQKRVKDMHRLGERTRESDAHEGSSIKLTSIWSSARKLGALGEACSHALQHAVAGLPIRHSTIDANRRGVPASWLIASVMCDRSPAAA